MSLYTLYPKRKLTPYTKTMIVLGLLALPLIWYDYHELSLVVNVLLSTIMGVI